MQFKFLFRFALVNLVIVGGTTSLLDANVTVVRVSSISDSCTTTSQVSSERPITNDVKTVAIGRDPDPYPGSPKCGCDNTTTQHTCWKFCAFGYRWCWTEPLVYCESADDCDPNAPCNNIYGCRQTTYNCEYHDDGWKGADSEPSMVRH